MIRHITIQEISSRFPEYHAYLTQINANNYSNIFFLDLRTEGTSPPIIYLIYLGQLGALHCYDGTLCIHTICDDALKSEALTIAQNVVERTHPYLSSALKDLKTLCNSKSSNALF